MKILLITAMLIASSSAFAAGKASTAPDAVAVDNACSAESQTAGCGDEKVGTGLMKCIHAYKKQHKKDFTITDGCKAAMKTWHQDHKGGKEKPKS